jgi:hypothetical protein
MSQLAKRGTLARRLALGLLAALCAGSLAAAEPTATTTTYTDGGLESVARRVCENKKAPIGSVREMARIITEIRRDESSCKDRYLAAIFMLEPLTMVPKEKLCDDTSFEMIKRYHFRFIQPHKRANRRPTQFEPMPVDIVKGQLYADPGKYTVEFDNLGQVLMTPISVRHFFLKFALQVSHQCKMNLIHNLADDATRYLLEDDLELMAPFNQLLGRDGVEPINFDNVLYMADLDGRQTDRNGDALESTGKEQQLRTDAGENSALVKLITACQNRFKPIYDRLIVPAVRLSKLGYDYQGTKGWSEVERQFLDGPVVHNWLVIVHVCEIFKNTKLVRLDAERMDGGDRKTTRSLMDLIEESYSDDEEDKQIGPGESSPSSSSPSSSSLATDDDQPPAPPEEGKLREMRPEEAALVESAAVPFDNGPTKLVDYSPRRPFTMQDELMIANATELDLELSRKAGHKNPFGFAGWLRMLSNCLKKALAKLDFERFAHYRRHSLLYAGVLNFISSLSNVASITVTVYSILHG